jgi:hypothetical protein
MEYNSQKDALVIPEYGRNVQLLVNFIRDHIPDKEERTRAAKTLVYLLSLQQPHMKNQPDFLQKIWGHIYIISDYKLDIDAPYPLPKKEEALASKNERLPYSVESPKYHFYGKNVELMIEKIMAMKESPEKEKLIKNIASYMKMTYKTWNNEKVSDEIVLKHLEELSANTIKINEIPDLPRNLEYRPNKNPKQKSRYGKKYKK